MNPAVKILPHYTYCEWETWEGQWELIEGIPHAMGPLPVPKHQQIATSLAAEFHFQLKKCKHCTTYQPLDYRVADDIILQPDMLVVCGSITKKYLDFPPALVAEILSPGTFLKDRHTKYSIYEAQGILLSHLVTRCGRSRSIFAGKQCICTKTKRKRFCVYLSF